MRAGNGYGENLDSSGGMGRTGSTMVGLERKLYRERCVSRAAGVAVAECERAMRSGKRWQWDCSLVLD